MGSNASRPGQQKMEMMPKLPPIFSRKLEEIRRRRTGTTLSKKKLLKDDYVDDGKSTESSPEPDDDSMKSAKVVPEPTVPDKIFSDKEAIAQEKSVEQDNKDNDNAKDEREKVVEAVATTMEKLALDETKHKQAVKEYGRDHNEGPLTFQGSPSFRCYLTDDDGKDDIKNRRSLSDTDIEAAKIVERQKSTEELATKMKKRGRKGMRFRRVIPTGKPVKNFLKVKSCYYPSCGGHEISRRLIATKSAR